jgi:hypothetical protein
MAVCTASNPHSGTLGQSYLGQIGEAVRSSALVHARGTGRKGLLYGTLAWSQEVHCTGFEPGAMAPGGRWGPNGHGLAFTL